MRPAWLPERLFPFESRFVETPGGWIHYVDEGCGRPLLLLHGNPTWCFLYRHLIPRLKGNFRCIAPDFPGFGLSTSAAGYNFKPASHTEVIEAFVTSLDLQDAIVMVQDWGGPIGLTAVADDPSRFSGLVIGNTFAWPVRGDPLSERFSALMGGAVARRLNWLFNMFPRLLLSKGVRRNRLSSEALAAYLGPFSNRDSRVPMSVFAREIIGSTPWLESLAVRLGGLAHLPALIVWGDRDFAFKEKDRRRFESIFQNSRTVLLPGAGHFIQEDAPDEIADAIISRFGNRRKE